jgi:hypothetical protein
MGKIKDNLLTKGFSGRVGDEMVFRQVDGETLVAKRRRKREVLTPKEQVVKNRFMDSVFYAKSVLADPAVKEFYELVKKEFKARSAYAAAVSDYLQQPKIGRVNAQNYKGNIGEFLYIVAENNAKIFQMDVKILRADGSVVESSAATLIGDYWRYETTTVNANVAGCKIVVTAKDRPGKATTFESAL